VKFNENVAENVRFEHPVGRKLLIAFGRRIVFVLFMVYATFFLAVATPFLQPHSKWIYIIGGIISAALLTRLLNTINRYRTLGHSALTISAKGVTLENKQGTFEIAGSSIQFCESTPFSDFTIRTPDKAYIFPMGILDRPVRRKMIALFADMAPTRTEFLRKAWELGDAIVMAMILAVHIIQFLVQNFYIPSGSMIATLLINDHLFAEKLTYGPRIPKMAFMKNEVHIKIPFISREIRKGDIIIFNPPSNDADKDYIKRCIAVEGDEFHIKDNAVYINGKKMEEPYVQGVTNYDNFVTPNPIEGIVPKGMVIAMGDNREHSSDSRMFGYVPVERIKAKAFLLYYNRDQFKKFDFARFGLVR
jgi:signal peptidase I